MKCRKCDGCGEIADSDDGEPWSGFQYGSERDRAVACVNALAGHDPREIGVWKRIENNLRAAFEATSEAAEEHRLEDVELLIDELDAIRKEKR